MNRIEIYLVILAVWGVTIGGAYFYGGVKTMEQVRVEQLKADSRALDAALTHAADLTTKDNEARVRAATSLDSITRGFNSVRDKFANLPSVMVDPSGCARFTSDFWLRWNQIESVPRGPAPAGPPGPDVRVPDHPVPPAR